MYSIPLPFSLLRLFAFVTLLVGTSSHVMAKSYTDNSDGTATDSTTGLTWMRCAMGQGWSGSTCVSDGTVSHYSRLDALALTGTVTLAGQTDWRLPSIRELQSIVDRSVVSPTIDSAAFPNTPTSMPYWSDSPDASRSYCQWTVDFEFGNSGSSWYRPVNMQTPVGSVRLVRGGQSLGLLNLARPNTDYMDHGDGTVTHIPTGLMWQSCPVGKNWTGSACMGTANAVPWDAARLLTSNLARYSDWRLPTEDELISLVDYTKDSLTINAVAFPNTDSRDFWSSALDVNISDNAWSVSFGNGYASSSKRSSHFNVRLVRSGKPLGR